MSKAFFILFSFFFFSSAFVQAQGIETLVKEIHLDTDNKQLAQKKAINEVSRKLVEEMVGLDRFQKEKQKIKNQIIKNQNRYILSIRSSKPILQEDGAFVSTVTIQVSKENLKQLLLEHNLFYSSKGSFCLLPVISFASYNSGEKKSYSWWLKNENSSSLLEEMAGSFFELLSEELIKQGFYALNPVFQKMYEGTASGVLPKNSSRVRSFVPLAEFYTCDIILSGHIRFGELSSGSSALQSFFSFLKTDNDQIDNAPSQNVTQFFFNVFNIKTRQFLFKLKKQFPFSPALQNNPKKEMALHLKNILDSFTYQLSFYQEKGSLDLNRLMISVQGPLNYSQKEQLKKSLVKKISGLQNLEKKFLTSNRIVYEAESSEKIKSVAQQLRKISLPKFVIQVKGYKKNTLEIYAKKRER